MAVYCGEKKLLTKVTVNGKSGEDITLNASDVGAAETQHAHTVEDLPITVSSTNLEDGVSALAAGTFHFAYEE